MSSSDRRSSEGLSAMPAKIRNLYQAQKPEIKITLNNNKRVYTTLDQLDGTVTITSMVDIRFDDTEIEFVGTSRTYVERLTTAAAISGRSEAFHQFLKLQQPRLRDFFPEDRVLKAGQTYEFPFVFVVPQQLLPRVCQHPIANDTLRDAHLQLPPTFGDKDAHVLDDLVPDMASVRYGIFVRVSQLKEKDHELVKTTIASKARKVRVVPATTEQPPLDIRSDDEEYCMRREKKIKKSLLKGKSGILTMETSQPRAIHLHSGREDEDQTTATVALRFDPHCEDCVPPRLSSMNVKLKVNTYFASTARRVYPSKSASLMDLSQGLHTQHLTLSTRCMENVTWEKYPKSGRRDSAMSLEPGMDLPIPEASESYKGKSFYVGRITVPIMLPKNKTFLPTFHSCLISRIYQVKLELGLANIGIGGGLELKVPLQIASDGSMADVRGRQGSVDSAMEMEVDDAEIDDYFEPRAIRSPSGNFIGRSRIGSQAPLGDAPPGYSVVAPHGASRSVPVH